jgi:hypothetical protein
MAIRFMGDSSALWTARLMGGGAAKFFRDANMGVLSGRGDVVAKRRVAGSLVVTGKIRWRRRRAQTTLAIP